MRRGDIVTVSAAGDYGKPRPAIIVQSNLFNETHASILVCLVTGDLHDAPIFRVPVEPDDSNGLRRTSQIMADKVLAVRRDRIGERVGQLDEDTTIRLNRSLALFLGLAEQVPVRPT